MSESQEKIHILAFSTNENHNPISILQIFLDQYQHTIIQKSLHAISFTLVLPKQKRPTKIMLCSILDLNTEFPRILDTNCYIIIIDLQSDKSKEDFDSIIAFSKTHFELDKMIYVLGIVNNNGKSNQNINKKYIKAIMDSGKFYYKYIELNLEKKEEVADSLLNIFNKCYKEGNKKHNNQAHSCNVF